MRHASRLLYAGILGVLTLGAAGCAGDEAVVEEVSPQELLNSSADRMAEVLSFAFLMEHENGVTPIVSGFGMERAEGWISEGNRMQAEIRALAGGSLAIDMGIVAVPDSAWMTNPFTRAWEPGTFDVSALFDPATGLTALLRGLTDPQILGVDQVNGIRTQRVAATVDSGTLSSLIPGAASGSPLAVSVWIGTEDPVLHRAEIVGAIGEGESADLLRRITLSRFGEDLPVVSPLAGTSATP